MKCSDNKPRKVFVQKHISAVYAELRAISENGDGGYLCSLEEVGFSKADISAILEIPEDYALASLDDYDSWDVPVWASSNGFHTTHKLGTLVFMSEFGLQHLLFNKIQNLDLSND